MTKFLNISTDTTLGGNSPSDETVSSQKAVKEYVDSQTGTAPAFANITGQPTDNTNLASALNGKQDTLTAGTGIDITSNTISADNIVWVTYGESAASTVASAIADGKIVLVNLYDMIYRYSRKDSSYYYFTAVMKGQYPNASFQQLSLHQLYDYWSSASVTIQDKNTAVTHTVSTAVGSATQPVYVASDGTATACDSYPTVNNATLTITQGGTTKGTFTANASTDVTIDLDTGGGSVDVDNKSITTNSSNEIQTVGVINSRDSSTAIKTWTGTKAQYDAITTKDSATLYNITDDTTITQTILEALYPVGSVYITTANTCPLSTLISGSTWTLVSSGIVKAGDIPCKGNGQTLGFNINTSGTTYGLAEFASYRMATATKTGAVGDSASISTMNVSKFIGITSDPTKSGIIADTSSLTLSVNIFERTA